MVQISEDELILMSREHLKEWFTTNNKSGCKSTEKWLNKFYPKLLKIINNNCIENGLTFPAKIAVYLNNLKETPKCVVCGNKCTYHKSMKYMFGSYCGNKCWMNSNKIKEKAVNNVPNKIKEMSLIESIYYKNNNGLRSTEDYIKKSHPNDYNKIIEYSKRFDEDISWIEKLYLYLNNLDSIPKCLYCGGNVEFLTFRKGYRTFCSTKCSGSSPQTQLKIYNTLHDGDYENKLKISQEKSKQTNLERYGCEKVLQNPEIREKIKKTNLERYGCENPIQNPEIREKIKQTNLERYGCEINLQNPETNKKIKQTNLEKYSCQYPSQSEIVKNKIKETNLKRYGIACNFSDLKTRERIKQTNLNKYGCENPTQNPEIREKIKKTNLERYGCEHPSQSEIVKNKIKETNLKRYGVEYLFQSSEFIKNAQKTMIEKYGEIWFKLIPKYNINSIVFLDKISDLIKLPIQHGLNGGEKKFAKYFVDGYIEKYNVVIEWDEIHHNCPKNKEKDLIREQYLIENHKCHIIRINEKQFLSDTENQIKIVVDKINEIINNT